VNVLNGFLYNDCFFNGTTKLNEWEPLLKHIVVFHTFELKKTFINMSSYLFNQTLQLYYYNFINTNSSK